MVKYKAGGFPKDTLNPAGIWLVFMCCVGAASGKFIALSSGCIGR
jgi:hypothetical protein